MIRNIFAVVLGVIIGAVLSVATDTVLEKAGVFPPISEGLFVPWMLLLATLYRTLYTVLSGYVTCLVASGKPMHYVKVLAVIALLANAAGIIVSIQKPELGPVWYPVLLTVLSYPATILGGMLRVRQIISKSKTA